MARSRSVRLPDGTLYGLRFDCPGCGSPHVITVAPTANPWGFDGDWAKPTVTPSILVHEVRIPADADPATVAAPHRPGDVLSPRCHSHIADGRIQFLPDCTHALAGRTVDLPEIPDEPRTAD